MPNIDKRFDDNVTKSDTSVNYLSIAEAARKLGVSERTVYRRIDKGEIPTAMVGDKRMILAHALTSLSEGEGTRIKALEAERPQVQLFLRMYLSAADACKSSETQRTGASTTSS